MLWNRDLGVSCFMECTHLFNFGCATVYLYHYAKWACAHLKPSLPVSLLKCAVASRNLSQKSTFIMPPKSRRSSRARTPSTRLNSPGSLAAKWAPDPSEHSAILTALNNIAERQNHVEARLAPLPQFDQAHVHDHLNVDQPTMATSTDVPVQVQEPTTVRSPGPTTAMSLALPGSVANNDTCGTLPVPPRLRDRIVRGEFVQFDDLLLESMSKTADDSLNLAVIGDGHLRIQRSSTEIKGRVCNLGTWLEAWTVFCRFLVDVAPELAPDVLQYQSIITEASAKYSEDAWLTYDRRFRMALAAQPHRFEWGVIDPNLWQSCMTGKALPSCPRCRLSHPTPGLFCPFPSGPSPAPSFGSGGPSHQTIFAHSGKPVCRNFNTGS